MRHSSAFVWALSVIFQSTHPRGVRPRLTYCCPSKADFNPRTHVGCDPSGRACPRRHQHFNPRTHVGCDTALPSCGRYPSYFNPRTHVGCDEPSVDRRSDTGEFQSTHPRGVRQIARLTSIVTKTFQSTHPRGVRPPSLFSDVPPGLFQSTHPRGVRPLLI